MAKKQKQTISDFIFAHFSVLIQTGILLIASTILIFYQFPSIPQGLAFDEVENGNLTQVLSSQPYTPYTEYATGHATLYYYILTLSTNIFGINTFALRLPAALFGLGSVMVFFYLMREIFQKQSFLAFALALLFISTRWYYNFVRFSFQASFLVFLELLSLLFLFLFIRSNNKVQLILSGIFAGLAFNSYQPGRLFFFIPLTFLIFFVGKKIGTGFYTNKAFYQQLAYFVIPFIILIIPLISYLSFNPDIRVQQQLYFTDQSLSFGEKAGYLMENIGKTATMFHFQGDLNGRHNYPGKPALNIIAGLLMLGGLIRGVIHYRSPVNALFLGYFLIALVPTLLTYPSENPHMLRTISVVPAVIYFCGLSLQLIYDTLISRIRLQERYVYVIVIGIIGLSALYDLRTYYVYQTQVFPEAFPITMPLDEAMEVDTEELPN